MFDLPCRDVCERVSAAYVFQKLFIPPQRETRTEKECINGIDAYQQFAIFLQRASERYCSDDDMRLENTSSVCRKRPTPMNEKLLITFYCLIVIRLLLLQHWLRQPSIVPGLFNTFLVPLILHCFAARIRLFSLFDFLPFLL